jgi:nicotinamidase-related amidase
VTTALILIDFQGECFNPAKLPIPGGAVAALTNRLAEVMSTDAVIECLVAAR